MEKPITKINPNIRDLHSRVRAKARETKLTDIRFEGWMSTVKLGLGMIAMAGAASSLEDVERSTQYPPGFWIGFYLRGYVQSRIETHPPFAIKPGVWTFCYSETEFSSSTRIKAGEYCEALQLFLPLGFFEKLDTGDTGKQPPAVWDVNQVEASVLRLGKMTPQLKLQVMELIRPMKGDRPNILKMHARIFDILATLSDMQVSRAKPAGVEARVEKVKSLVYRDLANVPSLDQLAREAGFSESGLKREFSAITGQPVGQFIRHAKMQHAAMRLTEGVSPAAAAQETGYSRSAFSTAFRQYFGCTPISYQAGNPNG